MVLWSESFPPVERYLAAPGPPAPLPPLLPPFTITSSPQEPPLAPCPLPPPDLQFRNERGRGGVHPLAPAVSPRANHPRSIVAASHHGAGYTHARTRGPGAVTTLPPSFRAVPPPRIRAEIARHAVRTAVVPKRSGCALAGQLSAGLADSASPAAPDAQFLLAAADAHAQAAPRHKERPAT